MKNILFVFGFLFMCQPLVEYTKLLSLDAKVSQIELDASMNMYLIEDAKISMYSPEGKLEYWYSNMYTKNLHNIDISNPEKILLFYKEDQKITLITQYFKAIPKPFFLNEKGYKNITMACTSSDGNIWIFDQSARQLIKLTDQGGFITQSGKFPEKLASDFFPVFMKQYKGLLYLSDPKTGISVFNQIGEYQETLPVLNVNHFRIESGQLYFVRDGKAGIYNLTSGAEKKYDMPVDDYTTATFGFQGDDLKVYVADDKTFKAFTTGTVDK